MELKIFDWLLVISVIGGLFSFFRYIKMKLTDIDIRLGIKEITEDKELSEYYEDVIFSILKQNFPENNDEKFREISKDIINHLR